jgi:hypothetical protein
MTASRIGLAHIIPETIYFDLLWLSKWPLAAYGWYLRLSLPEAETVTLCALYEHNPNIAIFCTGDCRQENNLHAAGRATVPSCFSLVGLPFLSADKNYPSCLAIADTMETSCTMLRPVRTQLTSVNTGQAHDTPPGPGWW